MPGTREYEVARKEARKTLRRKKRDFQIQRVQALENYYQRDEVRKFFAEVNMQRKGSMHVRIAMESNKELIINI